MNRVLDALIAPAAADVPCHRLADLVMSGFRIFRQQCDRLHDLAGLAVTALWDVDLTPGLLHRVITSWMQTLDGRYFTISHVGDRRDAGAHGLLVDDHGAGAAEGLTAAELGACQSDFVPQQ